MTKMQVYIIAALNKQTNKHKKNGKKTHKHMCIYMFCIIQKIRSITNKDFFIKWFSFQAHLISFYFFLQTINVLQNRHLRHIEISLPNCDTDSVTICSNTTSSDDFSFRNGRLQIFRISQINFSNNGSSSCPATRSEHTLRILKTWTKSFIG